MLGETICAGARLSAWSVDHVSDAPAARAALVDHTYSVVLLDIGLSGESGLTVLRAGADGLAQHRVVFHKKESHSGRFNRQSRACLRLWHGHFRFFLRRAGLAPSLDSHEKLVYTWLWLRCSYVVAML